MKKQTLLGFEIGTGKPVYISLTHLIVTGITQESGKTTTLEALIKRSGMRAVVFRTKIGERGFSEGTMIPPYFKERFDWEYVLDLLQSLRKEKLKFETGWIVKLCKKADSLLSLSNNIKLILSNEEKAKELFGRKLNILDQNVITTLDAYLDKILPELQVSRFSNVLELHDGVNIIDLERYSREVASLIIKSILDTTLKEFKNTIIVIPESWKFIPQDSGNPCKGSVISFIRQGATNGNYVWIDSQDITDTDKEPLKQISTWILGYQSEINEIRRTLDQISLPRLSKPKTEDISQLPIGHFYVTYKDYTKKVYVWPIWLDEKTAIKVAKGKINVEEIKKPETIAPFTIEPVTHEKITGPVVDFPKIREIEQKIIQTRADFFDKITQIQEMVKNLSAQILQLRSMKQDVNIDEVVSLVLQKIPMQQSIPASINEEEIVNKVLARVPKMGMVTSYTVAPLEKLQKEFLEEAKNRILDYINKLPEDMKKSLKFAEVKKPTSKKEIFNIGLGNKGGYAGGGTFDKGINQLVSDRYMRKDTHGNFFGNLMERIKEECDSTGITEEEAQQVYNHILMELLKG